MRTQFVTPEEYAKAMLELADSTEATGSVRPEKFREIMKTNRGFINFLSPFEAPEDGLERKNPVVVALGDSVTAGHFEAVGNLMEVFQKIFEGRFTEEDQIEIVDARVCYLEQFREMLIDQYEQTSVSTINSGIAGDTMYGMQKRVYRDVVRYQPDLVIINGSLNWGEDCGSTEDYKKVLQEVVTVIKKETEADIILLTPNMEIVQPFAPTNPKSSLVERVEVIREMAEANKVCLADAYKVWEAYQAAGYPVQELLANGSNHPSVTGHTVYAKVLMQLMK